MITWLLLLALAATAGGPCGLAPAVEAGAAAGATALVGVAPLPAVPPPLPAVLERLPEFPPACR